MTSKNRAQAVPAQPQERSEEHPVTRKIEQLDALLLEVAEDAERRSPSYLEESLVPEGGE